MNLKKLIISVLLIVTGLTIQSQNILVNNNVFDYLVGNSIRLKECLVNDSLCELENRNHSKELIKKDSIIFYKDDALCAADIQIKTDSVIMQNKEAVSGAIIKRLKFVNIRNVVIAVIGSVAEVFIIPKVYEFAKKN